MHDGCVLQGMKHTSARYLEEGDDVLGFETNLAHYLEVANPPPPTLTSLQTTQ